MHKEVIGVDIDDVLAYNAKGFVEWSNKRYGTSLALSDYEEHWSKLWGVDNRETERRAAEMYATGVLLRYESIPRAYETLKKLSDNYKLIIITSRRTQAMGDTLAWMEKFYPGLFDAEDINFAGIWDKINDGSVHQNKSALCRDLGVKYLIDDQLKHCASAASLGIKSLLFGNYDWNKCLNLPSGVTRISDWSGVGGYFGVE